MKTNYEPEYLDWLFANHNLDEAHRNLAPETPPCGPESTPQLPWCPSARPGLVSRVLRSLSVGWLVSPGRWDYVFAAFRSKAPILRLSVRGGSVLRVQIASATDLKFRARILLAKCRLSLWSLRGGSPQIPPESPNAGRKAPNAIASSEQISASCGTTRVTKLPREGDA